MPSGLPSLAPAIVDGVNDGSVVENESLSSAAGSTAAVQLLANDSDTDASDVLTVSSLSDVFGNGGAVPTETFNFQPVPLAQSNGGSGLLTVVSPDRCPFREFGVEQLVTRPGNEVDGCHRLGTGP